MNSDQRSSKELSVPKTVKAGNKRFSRMVGRPLHDAHPVTRKNVAIVTGRSWMFPLSE